MVFIVPRAPAIYYWNLAVRRRAPRKPGWLEQAPHDQSTARDYCAWPVVFLWLNRVSLYALSYLQRFGHLAIDAHVAQSWTLDTVHAKLCAYEAGIGVYGRSGLIHHPELGNRLTIGVILTEAVLEPDGQLLDYEPCSRCRVCVAGCPGEAYGPDGDYHTGWSEERCLSSRATGIACGSGGRGCSVHDEFEEQAVD